MAASLKSALLALALTSGDAKSLRSRRRRLADQLDLGQLSQDAGEGLLGTRVLFKLERGADASVAERVASDLDCDAAPARVFRDAGKFEAGHKAAGLNLHYQVECGKSSDKLEASSNTFAALTKFLDAGDHDGVAFVEAEYDEELLWTPNDPSLPTQTHYGAIKLPGAWDTTTGSPDVVVQVLDTGIDMSHPDLQTNIWKNPGEICGNGIDDDGNGYVDDCHGYNHADDTGTDLLGNHWHGSHCGGTIAADNNNGVGVAGVAGGDGSANSGAKLMISVAFGKTAVDGFAEALVYGADMGAQISSNSWGYTGAGPRPGYIAQNIKDAIDYYNTKNGIVVFAAGNSNSEADYYPGYYDGTIAVSAVADNGVRASFSNYGDWIEISAPGVSVYSTMLGTSYGYASGTSMACPHVAGVLALGMAHGPGLSKDELLECMYSTAMDIDADNGAYAGKLGAGMVDAEEYLKCVSEGAGDPVETTTTKFVEPTPVPTPAPTFKATKPPTTTTTTKTKPPPGDFEPVDELKCKMHKKVGSFLVCSWTHPSVGDVGKFMVEFSTSEDPTWVRVDEERKYHDELDGRFYQIVDAPCRVKAIVRVTALSDDGAIASEPVESDIKKMKCWDW
ncbi:serine-type endopeptidase [Aureococcus anophagefferens]|uniref:subtilisin n=1 Tax=Aureococcus anophagefferens TaxID=44056 RepID=A0ABR1G1B9_AURAN